MAELRRLREGIRRPMQQQAPQAAPQKTALSGDEQQRSLIHPKTQVPPTSPPPKTTPPKK